ncbi:MAG: glycosidase [Thermosediminibacteraceae bacterium]|nr:glycosidase [Thermosediminibacteraceae bacterium]
MESKLFYDTLESIKKLVKNKQKIDVVIGIPAFNEKTLIQVVRTAEESLLSEGITKLIVCVGDPSGRDIMESVDKKDGLLCFFMPEGASGKGFSVRAIFEVARFLESDVILMEADFNPQCLNRLYIPITEGYDMAVASFLRHPLEDTIGSLLVSPLFTALYGVSISDPLSGVYAISHDLVEDFCIEFDQHNEHAGGEGVTAWLIATALRWGKRMCEVRFGPKLSSPSFFDKKNEVFKALCRATFECALRDEDFWLKDRFMIKRPDIALEEGEAPPLENINIEMYVMSFKKNFERYESLFEIVLERDSYDAVKKIAFNEKGGFEFPAELWAKIVYDFLIAYSFQDNVHREDILDALYCIYNGRVAGYAGEILALESALSKIGFNEKNVVCFKAKSLIEAQERAFIKNKNAFKVRWKERGNRTKQLITPLDYLEFIPSVPIVLPKKLRGYRGKEIYPSEIFKRLQRKYSEAFENYIRNVLNIKEDDPGKIVSGFESFITELEKTIDNFFPGDLTTEEGVLEVCEKLFRLFPHRKVLCVKWEILRKLLYEFPPRNLLVRLNFRNMRQLLDNMDVRDILTLAQFTEPPEYYARLYEWLKDNLRPDSFEEVELLPIVLSSSKFPALNDLGDITKYNRLTARIAVVNLSKGKGGKYPKLRYFTRIAKSIIEAEHYSRIWEIYASERREVGQKFVNSITRHYGKEVFSAHRVFENWHQREFVARLKKFARNISENGRREEAQRLWAMAEGYGLSLTLQDGTFLPCSAWTWASYSFKGGKGVPTPLSLHVERDWFNHDLLEEIYKEMGYNPEDIMDQVFQLIGLGREYQDLRDVLLGVKPPKEEVVVQEVEDWPPAGVLKRYEKNPILNPRKENWWENKYVLNAAALRIKDKVYLLYRAFGQDEVSRIGLAITDGYTVLERLSEPIFVPETKEEIKGCEDPRVVIIDDEIIMLYTAYDGVVAQIAAASISVEDFLSRNFDRWKRRGLAFPGLWDKDAILFPEKIGNKYVIYHRIEPSIWVSYSDKLVFPWPQEGHKIIIGPRSGMMWDSLKIGAGAQPLKTRFGWLLIYHGVDHQMVYRLGVILTDLNDPGRVLYRSPNPILSPETECELGKEGECWVPNVVFTCGAVPAEDKEILDENDEILVYYGAADTNICVATGKVGDLIPEKVRQRLKRRSEWVSK